MLKFLFIGVITLGISLNAEELTMRIAGEYTGRFSIKQKVKTPRPPTKQEIEEDKALEKKNGKKSSHGVRYKTKTTCFKGGLTFTITSIKHKYKRTHEWKIIMNITNNSKGKEYKIQESFNILQTRNKVELTAINEKHSVFTRIAELMLNNLLTRKLLIDTEKVKSNFKGGKLGKKKQAENEERGIILLKLKQAKKRPDNITDIFVTESNKKTVKLTGSNSFLYIHHGHNRRVRNKQNSNAIFLRKDGYLLLSAYSFTLKTKVVPNGQKYVNMDVDFDLKRVNNP
jgi:hypothetical protein